MSNYSIVRGGFLLILTGLAAVPSASDADEPRSFRVVGYLPDYRAEEFDPQACRQLTDLMLFSAEPMAAGELDLKRLQRMPWEKLRQFKTQERVRLILCVGGWNRSASFAAVATSAEKRRAFAQSAVRVCLAERLDGIDLDWEHPKNESEQTAYGQLLSELREAFKPHGLALSVTMAAWQQLPQAAFAAVDSVQVMSYDHDGQHSLPEAAESDVRSLLDRGIPAQKIVLGLPFYGRPVKGRGQALTYREVAAKYAPASNVDEVSGVYFNGPDTIRRKTNFALQSQLGGVMVWELGQDAKGDQSLLRVIRQTVDSHR